MFQNLPNKIKRRDHYQQIVSVFVGHCAIYSKSMAKVSHVQGITIYPFYVYLILSDVKEQPYTQTMKLKRNKHLQVHERD